jgi:erythromycin esterase-like protein
MSFPTRGTCTVMKPAVRFMMLGQLAGVLALASCASPMPAAAGALPVASSALDRVVSDICGKQVVLLGEPGHHGSGPTLQAKVQLVRRLTDECGFSALFMESGLYDFVDLEHSLAAGSATPEQLGDAITALWSTAQEIEPMVVDLLRKARAGRVRLAGLDHQISSTALYAQRDLPVQLVSYLGERRGACEAALLRHTQWKYDDASQAEEALPVLVGCLTEVQAAIAARPVSPISREAAFMASRLAIAVTTALSPMPRAEGFNVRDRAMYEAFQWHAARLAPGSKIIVWCATIHAAKDLRGITDAESLIPLGWYLHRDLGERAAAIGFSAQGGSWARVRPPAKPLAIASPDSLEGQAFAPGGADVRYFDRSELARLGPIASRAMGETFSRVSWAEVVDGMVVFREERPPTFVRGPSPQRVH